MRLFLANCKDDEDDDVKKLMILFSCNRFQEKVQAKYYGILAFTENKMFLL